MWEIRKDINDGDDDKSKAVIMQHGIMDSPECFMVTEANYNWTEAYIQNGYTIFLHNSRGNGYSTRRININGDVEEDTHEYYQFSLYEMAMYDLPAAIHKAIELNGYSNFLKYVGFSQGNMIMNIALQYSNYVRTHISHYVAIAPILTMNHIKSKNIKNWSSNWKEIYKNIINPFDLKKVKSNLNITKDPEVCNFLTTLNIDVCTTGINLLNEIDTKVEYLNDSYFLKSYPAQTSTKTLINFAQIISSKHTHKLQAYDYGYKSLNIKAYQIKLKLKNELPNLDKLNWPQNIKYAMFVGKFDNMTSSEDWNIFYESLNKANLTVNVYTYNWGHFGFILSSKANIAINDSIKFFAENKSENIAKAYKINPNAVSLYSENDGYARLSMSKIYSVAKK